MFQKIRKTTGKPFLNGELEDQKRTMFFRVFAIDVSGKTRLGGSARKAGMDEAARRFEQINRPDGVIMNLMLTVRLQIPFAAINDEFCKRKIEKPVRSILEHP